MDKDEQKLRYSDPDYSHIDLTLVMPAYFDQKDTSTLTDLLESYSKYPKDLLDHLQIVIVDDGSPIKVELPENLNLNILMLHINEDIIWNQSGARNLGLVYARSDKVILTDLDHMFPEDTLRHMIEAKNPGRTMYRLAREDLAGNKYRAHATTFFMSRGRFFKFYGFDEELSGHYGHDECHFWRWQKYNGTRFPKLNKKYKAVMYGVDRGEGYHSLHRDTSYNKKVADRKRREWAKYGPSGGHTRQFLNFTWSTISDLQRVSEVVKKENHIWAKNWWLRWLFG